MNYHRLPHMYVEQVDLNVVDLIRSVEFYTEIIGLQLLKKENDTAILSADGSKRLITLRQPLDVIPKQRRTTGLYHFALLLPDRKSLGSVLSHLIETGYPLQGASDHLVSEAIYLADPDGNGIEIYRDRNDDAWNWQDGEIEMASIAMDVKAVLAEAEGKEWKGLPRDTVMGHIHLHVAELEKIRKFYCDGLGFDVVNSQYGEHVLFISAGGYHHHIGLNTWNGVGAPKPSRNSVGLNYYTVVIAREKMDQIKIQLKKIGATYREESGILITEDPSGNVIHFTRK